MKTTTKRALAALAAGALTAGIGASAYASHVYAEEVDAIDGVGEGTYPGTYDGEGETDWYAVQLVKGELLTVATDSGSDPVVALYASQGIPKSGDVVEDRLAFDDDSGPGLDSLLQFTAEKSGWYLVQTYPFFEDATFDYEISISTSMPDASQCPMGWDLIFDDFGEATDVDANEDGFVCLKDIPSDGSAESNQGNANGKTQNAFGDASYDDRNIKDNRGF